MTGVPPLENSFARLLVWYPRRWRRRHGDVLLSTLLEDAESTGRTRPSRDQRRAAMLHGLAAHLDERTALVAGLAGLLLALLDGALALATLASSALELPLFAGRPPVWVVLVSAGVTPALAFVAIVAVARSRGLLPDGRALLLAVLAVVANLLGALASISWALGFDAADAGRPITGLAAGWTPLVLSGLVVAAFGLGLFSDALLARTSIHRVGRTILAILLGVIAAPVLGYALITPGTTALIAVVAVILALLTLRRRTDPAYSAPAIPPRVPAAAAVSVVTSRESLAAIRGLSGLAFFAGMVGLAWAFCGSLVFPSAGDATEAMRVGIAVLCVAALPLLAGWAILSVTRARRRAVHSWGPALLSAAGFASLAVHFVTSSGSGEIGVGMFAATGLLGAALGWFIATRIRLRGWAAILAGVASGLAYSLWIGLAVTALLAFATPLLAVAVFMQARRRQAPVLTPEPAGA